MASTAQEWMEDMRRSAESLTSMRVAKGSLNARCEKYEETMPPV